MTSIKSLATEVAERARRAGVHPPLVVDAVLNEHGIKSDDVRHLVLSECGRRGGKAPRRKRQLTSAAEKRKIWEQHTREQRAHEVWSDIVEANYHICPVD